MTMNADQAGTAMADQNRVPELVRTFATRSRSPNIHYRNIFFLALEDDTNPIIANANPRACGIFGDSFEGSFASRGEADHCGVNTCGIAPWIRAMEWRGESFLRQSTTSVAMIASGSNLSANGGCRYERTVFRSFHEPSLFFSFRRSSDRCTFECGPDGIDFVDFCREKFSGVRCARIHVEQGITTCLRPSRQK